MAAHPMESRHIVSPASQALVSRRAAEFGAVAFAGLALALLIALTTYDPRDPSFNTATSRHPSNLAGPVGAYVADALIQNFGLASVLPGLALLAWAWRVGSRRGLGGIIARLISLLLAIPMLAALLSFVPMRQDRPLPSLGGAIGALLTRFGLDVGYGLLGPFGIAAVALLGTGLAIALTLLALGLTSSEWRTAARTSARVARFSFSGSRDVARLLARSAGKVNVASSWLTDITRRRPGMTPDDERPRGSVRSETEAAGTAAPARALAAPSVRQGAPRAAAFIPPAKARQESLPLPEPGWRFPPLSLLKPPPARASSGPSQDSLQANARLLENVLSDYGVQGSIVEIRPGPVVTLYELEPAPGIRSARVIGLADDVARSLSVTAVRIATVPGRNVIGIEVPNARRETVFLSEILESEELQKHSGRLSLALGKDISGAAIVADLSRMPHLMIAGTTGSGKSVGVNAMILSLLYRLSPDQCRLILIDPKMLELSTYEGIPHLMAPVVTEPAKAVTALKWTVREMERRYRSMSQLGVRNITGYNERVAEARARGEVVTRRVQTGFDPDTGRPTFEDLPLALELLPLIVVVVDEMADLMMVAGKEIEAAVQRLAQMARAAGIHVIMATQRPSVDVITGTIKANFPTRISFQVISKFDSRTILGEQGAEQLLGMGDMLFMQGGGRITRVHGPFVSDDEVEKVVAFLRAQGEPAYLEDVT
ncbi:MAG: DNA translocase FtsK 4TM domain-containing protein, partial [Acetobacteraceae bacterium]|nr:DNA translocase FtsK 4TM domain-containing protein [Acetobacteraceae bacterium]